MTPRVFWVGMSLLCQTFKPTNVWFRVNVCTITRLMLYVMVLDGLHNKSDCRIKRCYILLLQFSHAQVNLCKI